MRKDEDVTGKELLLGGLPLEGKLPTEVDFSTFTDEEAVLLESELDKWKGKYGARAKEWNDVQDDVKRRIGLLIQSGTINNVNKKLNN
jgi:hypothetical protein